MDARIFSGVEEKGWDFVRALVRLLPGFNQIPTNLVGESKPIPISIDLIED